MKYTLCMRSNRLLRITYVVHVRYSCALWEMLFVLPIATAIAIAIAIFIFEMSFDKVFQSGRGSHFHLRHLHMQNAVSSTKSNGKKLWINELKGYAQGLFRFLVAFFFQFECNAMLCLIFLVEILMSMQTKRLTFFSFHS